MWCVGEENHLLSPRGSSPTLRHSCTLLNRNTYVKKDAKGHLLVEIKDVEVVEVIDLQRGVSCGSETWGQALLVVVVIATITITITITITTNSMLPHNQYHKSPRKARVSSCAAPCGGHFADEDRSCTEPADVQHCNG